MIGTVFVFVSRTPPFLAVFEDAAAFEDYVRSDVKVVKTTFSELQTLLDSGTYGELDCAYSQFDLSAYVCSGRSWIGGWNYYTIVFNFKQDILIDLEAYSTYIGL